ncbi:MAG: TetR family transcriptional regulator [Firmicutes bacterium]|jgi:AcrR family transcriptional regulator|nr:TetR family transcriptional regulator [Bacillota bacterium]
MANFTSRAIKESFIKLLNEKPMNKISVKDIVEDCGINRNSFYYHFQDIPALLEEIVEDEAAAIIEKYPSINTLDECFHTAFEFALKNKRATFHIYKSVNRDFFENGLMKLCEYVVSTYINTAFSEANVNNKDKEILIRFIKCECFGLVIEWLNSGMPDDAINDLLRITELCKGLSEELIRRSQNV